LWLAALVVLALELAHRVWNAFGNFTWLNWWSVLVAGALLAVAYFSRRSAQIVQDRCIRHEMQTRLERVLGASRRADIARFRLRELVALRFASDAELPALCEEVLAGRVSRPDEIKRRIKDWQADWLRV
jgi:hypothetical protein